MQRTVRALPNYISVRMQDKNGMSIPSPLVTGCYKRCVWDQTQAFHFSVLYADCSNNQMIVHFLVEHIHQFRLQGIVINLQMDEWISSDSLSQNHGLLLMYAYLLPLIFGEFTTGSCKNMTVCFTMYVFLHVIWNTNNIFMKYKIGKLH
jgi:hypothetical protein